MAQSTNSDSVNIQGKTRWFKAIGEPRDKYGKPGREWTWQISLDKASRDMIRNNKVRNKIQDDEDVDEDSEEFQKKFGSLRLGKYTTLRKDATDKEGNPLPHVKIVDTSGEPWPQDKWVGNGSTIDVDCKLIPFGPFVTKEGITISGNKLVPVKITVMDHIPYQAKPKADVAKADDEEWVED